jgi:hypothetical protein
VAPRLLTHPVAQFSVVGRPAASCRHVRELCGSSCTRALLFGWMQLGGV